MVASQFLVMFGFAALMAPAAAWQGTAAPVLQLDIINGRYDWQTTTTVATTDVFTLVALYTQRIQPAAPRSRSSFPDLRQTISRADGQPRPVQAPCARSFILRNFASTKKYDAAATARAASTFCGQR